MSETEIATAETPLQRNPANGHFLPGNSVAKGNPSPQSVVKAKQVKLLDSILKHEQERAEDVGKTWWDDATSRNAATRARARETLFDRLYEPPTRRVALGGSPELLAAVLEMRDLKRRLLGEPFGEAADAVVEGEVREVVDGEEAE